MNVHSFNTTDEDFKPQSRQELLNAIDKCLQVHKDCATGPKGAIGWWDVSDITDMTGMFSWRADFNGAIKWDVSSVEGMHGMFEGASSFNQDITKWDVSKVTIMGSMFAGASSFNQDISKWSVARVVSMYKMFDRATSFNQDISKWDVSKVNDMRSMFSGASSFNQDITKWKVSSMTNMGKMFDGASSFKQTLCGKWRESKASKGSGIFTRLQGSQGSIGGDKACSTQAATPSSVFKPFSKEDIEKALRQCSLAPKQSKPFG